MKKCVKKFFALILALTVVLGPVAIAGVVPEASAASFSPRFSSPTRDGVYSPYSSYNPFKVNYNAYGGNCTWYAWGRAYEILGKRPSLSNGNACQWYPTNVSNGSYPYGSKPKLGAIACWSGGSSDCGHVAIVEQINSDGSFVISESGWSNCYFRTRTIPSNGYSYDLTFQGFIYILPDSKPSATTPSFKTEGYEGGVKVTLSAGSGDTIYYGIGNSSCPNKYTGPFNVTSTQTVYAVSKASGKTDAKKEQKITVNKTGTPNIEVIPTATNYSVKISAETGASIYYTLDGSAPNTDSNKYTNAFPLTNNATVKAIAVKKGSVLSDTVTQQVTMSAPDAPSIRLESNSKIPVGDYAYVSWTKDSHAQEYVVSLYDSNSNLISSKITENNSEKFLLSTVGKYKIDVKARNFIGDSEKSFPAVSVEAMEDCIVTFKNGISGEIISTQRVRYGYSATAPADPVQEGYDFTAWDTTNLNNIVENKTITAKFKIKTYTVKFCDLNGDILKSETVEWHKAATPPTAPAAPLGKTFAGWVISTYDNGYDYKSVDGNMSFIPSYKWADDKLDVAVEIISATRNNTGNAYDVTVDVVANDSRASNTKLIVALMADGTNSDGQVVEDKLVKAQTAEVQLSAGATKTTTVTVNTSEKATKVKVYAVGYDNSYEVTGGAQSLAAEAPVTATTAWTSWSDWTTENNASAVSGDKESKAQYRYRDKVYSDWTTATSMDGYTRVSGTDGTKTVYGSWGSWGSWTTSRQSSSDTKEEQSKTVYGYYYYRCPRCGAHMHVHDFGCIGWADGCGYSGSLKAYWVEMWSDTPWSNAGLKEFHGTGKYYTDSLSGGRWFQWNDNGTPRTGYRYRTRSKTVQYKYEKWSSWSDWQDTAMPSSSTREIETRTVYRYRSKVATSDPAAGTVNVNGTRYTKNGTLNLEEDLSGLYATVMVYKGKNGDPTSSAIEYVGQIKIGSGNSWSVSFVPREEISAATGDFYITLGIEGVSSLITVDTISYVVEKEIKYTVNFYDDNGSILKTQQVTAGSDAVPPANPSAEGKTFIGWDTAIKNITKDTDIVAKYADNSYAVVYVNWVTQEIDTVMCKYGDTINLPEAPEVDGYIFTGWNNTSDTVTGNMVIETVYNKVEHTVTFLNQDGTVFETQSVKHGEAANLPGPCEVNEDCKFVDWSNETSWYNVTDNITVEPITEFSETALTPIISVNPDSQMDENKYIDNVEIEITVEPETKALYRIDRTVDLLKSSAEEEWIELDGNTIKLYSDATVLVKATGANMNDSEIAEYSVEVISYDEYQSTLPVVTSIPDNSNYKVGETTATLVMRIDNPENRIITEWGCYVTEVIDGESVGETLEFVNTEIGNSITYPIGRAFDIDELKPGTNYIYYFYAVCEDNYYGSDVCTFTTSGEAPETHTCIFNEVITKAPTCSEDGIATLTCSCGKTNGIVVIPALGHYDYNGDGICDECNSDMSEESGTLANVNINVPNDTKVSYKQNVTVVASASNLPADCELVMYDGSEKIAFAKPDANGNAVIENNIGKVTSDRQISVKIEKNGNTQSVNGSALQKDFTVSVNTKFFSKLLSFFKNLFGLLKAITIEP